MGTYTNGVYIPAIGEVGWGDEVDDFLTQIAREKINVRLAPYGAKGDGATDDTAAFDLAALAAGKGGTLYVPDGVYILTNWTPPYQVNVVGAGCPSPLATTTGTTLKASATAAWVIKLLGTTENLYNPSVRHLRIHGNLTAGGLTLNSGADVHGIQSPFFEDVEFYRCTTGTKIDTSLVTEADKVVFMSCRWVEAVDEGLWLNSTNADLVAVHGGYVTGATVAVRLTAGTASFYDFSIASCGTSFLFDSSGFGALTLIDVIDEDIDVGLQGASYWPSQGVVAIGCVFQADTYTANMGVSGIFYAMNCQFHNGTIVGGTNAVFVDTNCRFVTPALWTPTVAANASRLSTFPQVDSARGYAMELFGGANGTTSEFQVTGAGTVYASDTIQALHYFQAGDDLGNTGRIYFGDDPNGVFWGASAGVMITQAAVGVLRTTMASDIAFLTNKIGESVAWWSMLADGKMTWGPGGGSPGDTEVSRSAANTLSMPAGDTFRITGAVHGSLPSAASFAAGAQTYCTTDKKPIWSDGSAHWVDAAGANHT